MAIGQTLNLENIESTASGWEVGVGRRAQDRMQIAVSLKVWTRGTMSQLVRTKKSTGYYFKAVKVTSRESENDNLTMLAKKGAIWKSTTELNPMY